MLPGFVLDSPIDLAWDDRVNDRIERFGHVTLAVDREVTIDHTSIALLVDRADLVAVGRLVKGSPITTFERRVSLSDISHLQSPADLVAQVDQRLRRHAETSLDSHGRVPPATWQAIR